MVTAMSTPSHPPRDDDEAFRQIVEGFAEDARDPVPRWPVSEDLEETPEPPTVDDPRSEPLPVPSSEPLPAWLEPAALEDEGHFVPPPPPRLPRVRLRTLGATLMLVAGFAVMLVPFQVGLDDTPPSFLLGMALAGGGAALLVAGLRDSDDDRGPDDGAVV